MRLTDDMRAIIEAAHLCFAATVTPDGRPNLSPKGTIRAWDDDHLFFLDIASPRTTENLAANGWIVLNVVEQLSRRGYRFSGKGTFRGPSTPEYSAATQRVFREEGSTYPVRGVVLIELLEADPLVSPGYLHVQDEDAMRALWRVRRAELDEAFEARIARQGAWRPV